MNTRLLVEVILWIVIAAGTVAARTTARQRSVGLVLAYIANMWLIHWPAAVTYLLPWFDAGDSGAVIDGFEQSFYAVLGLALGAILVAPFLLRVLQAPRSHTQDAERRMPNKRLPYTYIFVGAFTYVFVAPVLSAIPTVSAIATGTSQLIVVGLCLVLWYAWFAKQRRRFAIALGIACMLPLATILREGFLSYGAMALIAIMTFLAVFVRPRGYLAMIGLIVGYVGFSFYVTYIRDRNDIRATVWGGGSASTRVESLSKTVGGIEWFNPYNPAHLMRVDARLNQNYLVGAAVGKLTNGGVEFAHGETVLQAFESLIPRVLWPEKPQMAGSPEVVAQYTGYTFAAGTSVGVGQVMEFYINFGTAGVIVGFMLFGALITMLDTWAAQRLWAGDWLQFAVWYLPGLAMMQAGGSLVEVVSSAGASVLAVLFVNKYVVSLRMQAPQAVSMGATHF